MKFTCEKYLLIQAVNTASRAAAVKSAVAALEGLLIEAEENKVTISGYDLKTGITTSFPADIEESGRIVINSKLFGDIVRKMSGDFITITTEENFMTNIKSGMSEFDIMGSPSEDYPEIPSVDSTHSIVMEQKALKAMISQTSFAVSDNEARPIHTGELFETENNILTMVAVDGYRLALRREELKETADDDLSFVVPGAALNEVEKILSDTDDDVTVNLGPKHILFKIGDTVLISRRLEGEFLNYKKSIPMTGKYDIKADKKIVLSAVERVSLIINDKLKSPLRCRFSDGVLKLLAVTPLGRASDECEIEGSADDLDIGFNNKYLMDALKAAPSDNVIIRLSTGVTPCLVLPEDESNSFLYMILPVRLKTNEG